MTNRISDETDLIQKYLAPLTGPGAFGLRDDAALIETETGIDIVATNDPIVAGVHFFPDDDPRDIAWKALAVNASDLAAKGAQPFAYTMALAFPEAPLTTWMAAFSAGLAEAQHAFGCQLIGGDTDRTPGPLSISITALGKVPRGQFVPRQGARIGDRVYVTGTLGDAALGLYVRRGGTDWAPNLSEAHQTALRTRYWRPQARVQMAEPLRRFARAALDVSDGLLKDAARLAAGAGGGLLIKSADLPLSEAARAALALDHLLLDRIVAGGDDYEILCAVAPPNCASFEAACATAGVRVSALGFIVSGQGVSIVSPDGHLCIPDVAGYDHFSGPGS